VLSIREFCVKRGVSKKIEEAFYAYCKASLSEYFDIRSGETLSKLIKKLNNEQIEEMWGNFKSDLNAVFTEDKLP
jgi:hypothetical protein